MATLPPIDVEEINEECEVTLSSQIYVYRNTGNNNFRMFKATINDLSSILVFPEELSVITEKINKLKTTITSFKNMLQQNYMLLEDAEANYDLDGAMYDEIKSTWETLQTLEKAISSAGLASNDYLQQKRQEVLQEQAKLRYSVMTDIKHRLLSAAKEAGGGGGEE